jgi:hypothetical protein
MTSHKITKLFSIPGSLFWPQTPAAISIALAQRAEGRGGQSAFRRLRRRNLNLPQNPPKAPKRVPNRKWWSRKNFWLAKSVQSKTGRRNHSEGMVEPDGIEPTT